MKTVEGLVVVVVALVVLVAQGAAAQSCLPDCNGKEFGDQVTDPLECHNYYLCFGNNVVSDHSVPCENGTYFNETEGGCIAETDSCTNACGGGSGGLGCKLTCNRTSSGELELISDIDCSKYYICLAGGVSQPIVCPSDHPYFDGAKCGDDPSSCCTRICEPYCPGPSAIVPDPKDCKRFYFCSEEGTPDEDFAFKCPDGKNFNLQLGECTSDAECVIICSNNSSATTLPGQGHHHLVLLHLHGLPHLPRQGLLPSLPLLRPAVPGLRQCGGAGHPQHVSRRIAVSPHSASVCAA
ncbi:hypothetical protein O3P69_019237 [Scylla paramamosain]|uniref:Chitin-binding type-2 domain-containing protein n=1 Tax=Scylla paramamosain TaxID=85552 RepID=A0AAW0SV08_SCYPA